MDEKRRRKSGIYGLRKMNTEKSMEMGTWLHISANSIMTMYYALQRMVESLTERVDNHFEPLQPDMQDYLDSISAHISNVLTESAAAISRKDIGRCEALRNVLSAMEEDMRDRRKSTLSQLGKTNSALSYLLLGVLQESEVICANVRHTLRAQKYLLI